jgi:hypothetical protein
MSFTPTTVAFLAVAANAPYFVVSFWISNGSSTGTPYFRSPERWNRDHKDMSSYSIKHGTEIICSSVNIFITYLLLYSEIWNTLLKVLRRNRLSILV